ncbi:hypothetical protein KEM55_005964 [Ascosphaera atra]|nr:hypothetical protein KEM55_005964 [Ascosphaera atra]
MRVINTLVTLAAFAVATTANTVGSLKIENHCSSDIYSWYDAIGSQPKAQVIHANSGRSQPFDLAANSPYGFDISLSNQSYEGGPMKSIFYFFESGNITYEVVSNEAFAGSNNSLSVVPEDPSCEPVHYPDSFSTGKLRTPGSCSQKKSLYFLVCA